MPESFGARLRQQREAQQVTLSAIAEQTKIQQSLLEGLERDDVCHWPTGIFRRAFIRAYAIAIGLDPDVVVQEFRDCYPDPSEVAETSTVDSLGGELAARTRPPTRFRYLVGTAMDSLTRRRTSVALPRVPLVDPAPRADAPCPAPSTPAPPPDADFQVVARLCTELGRAENTDDALPFLRQAATLLDAIGFIVWAWDRHATELRPAVAYGYSAQVLAQLPPVKSDGNNATAAAFRSAQTCIVDGPRLDSDALVVPLLTPTGCVGVFAVELPHGTAQKASAQALVTIIAAHLGRVVTSRTETNRRRA